MYKMSLPRIFRLERKVPSSLIILGTILVVCFLISVWFRSPSPDYVSEESRVPLNEDDPTKGNGRSENGFHSYDSVDKNSEIDDKIRSQDEFQNDEEVSAQSSTNEPRESSQNKELSKDNEDLLEGKGDKDSETEKHEESHDGLLEPTVAESEITVESNEKSFNWSTQVIESNNEKRKSNLTQEDKKTSLVIDEFDNTTETHMGAGEHIGIYNWELCTWQGAMDYIPCLDNKQAIKRLPSIRRFQHRERHCPSADKYPMCLVPIPKGYKVPISWPRSKDEIWLDNAPHTKLVSYKKDQNWVKLVGDKLVFPGGGTQFKHGASKYIDSVEEHVTDVAWGKHTRVVLDIGCGVASFGAALFDRDVITMSFAPKDEHEAQVQLALERGIPAISAVMGTQRLPFPSNAFDLAHCARCRIHWHGDGGKWLIEVNRVLRPGGYFVWSATPVYQKHPEDVEFWNAMVAVTKSMCWKLTVKVVGISSGVGFAVYQKPTSNSCYETQSVNETLICTDEENPDAAWYTPMENCMQKVPTEIDAHGSSWPPLWPERLESTPRWLKTSKKSLFGKPADDEMVMDTEHWRRVVSNSYLTGLGIDWGHIRNVMDMNARFGGFAASLLRTSAWVMNVVPIDEPDTLPVIFDRGLIGIYHDWCESFNTYPRTYDLLHADHIFTSLMSRSNTSINTWDAPSHNRGKFFKCFVGCQPVLTLLEMDRILRPQGWIILREKSDILRQIRAIFDSLHWEVRLTYIEGEEEIVALQKTFWRPKSNENI